MQNKSQRHTHEFTESTTCDDKHCHRIAVVSGPAIERENGSHVHYMKALTTFNDEHHHRFEGYSGPPIRIGDGFHTHMVAGATSFNDGHKHLVRGIGEAAPHTPSSSKRTSTRRVRKRHARP